MLIGWCESYSDWESNPDFRFRKPTFYPLNYQSMVMTIVVVTLFCGAKIAKYSDINRFLAHILQ